MLKRGAAEFFLTNFEVFGYFDNQLESTCQVISLASQFDTEDDRVYFNEQLESICQVNLRTNTQLAELLGFKDELLSC